MTSFSEIEQRIQESNQKKDIRIVAQLDKPLDELTENVMLGSFSWYYTQSHRKEIQRNYAYNFGTFISTPSELSRTYLSLKYERQRATKSQIEDFRRPRVAPLYAQPVSFGEGNYVDIRAAYWQIVQVVGWDVDYYPGHWLGKSSSMEDFPFPDFKLSRNCLVTSGLPSEASYWDVGKQKISRVKTFNKLVNLGIWALVMDVLHCVAWDCVAAGASYVHTDGYICHNRNLENVVSAISSWGLQARVKQSGQTTIYGVGSYRVGDKVTKNSHVVTNPYDGLELPSYFKWLKKRFSALAERTNLVWTSDWQEKIKSNSFNASGRSENVLNSLK